MYRDAIVCYHMIFHPEPEERRSRLIEWGMTWERWGCGSSPFCSHDASSSDAYCSCCIFLLRDLCFCWGLHVPRKTFMLLLTCWISVLIFERGSNANEHVLIWLIDIIRTSHRSPYSDLTECMSYLCAWCVWSAYVMFCCSALREERALLYRCGIFGSQDQTLFLFFFVVIQYVLFSSWPISEPNPMEPGAIESLRWWEGRPAWL